MKRLIKFIKRMYWYHTKRSYLACSLDVQRSMWNKQDEITITIFYDNGSSEEVTYLLKNNVARSNT